MTSTSIRAICWDWNGTLLDDAEICRQVMNRVLLEYGREPLSDLASYRSVFRFPIRDFYADVGLSDELFVEAAGRYLEWLLERTGEATLHRDARRTLAAVDELGIRQVLASATMPDALRQQMSPHGLDATFERVLAIDDPYRPSKHGVIAEWLDSTGLAPAEVLLIGDTNHDLEIADALGTAFVHFAAGHQSEPGRAPTIDTLVELLPLLGHNPMKVKASEYERI